VPRPPAAAGGVTNLPLSPPFQMLIPC
jgi:hypothetical protein